MIFKVGDWVIRGSVTATNKLIFKIKAFGVFGDEELALFNGHSAPLNELTLWQPKLNEWVWQSKWDRHIVCLEYSLVRFIIDMNEVDDEYEYRYEPFIGELPSFLQH